MKTTVLGACFMALVAVPRAEAAVPAVDGEQRLRLADGVEMAYVARGAGEPALVFVHCGNCRKEIWRETLEAFAPRHRVVAMDLPGHGASGADRERFTVASYGDDVAALVEHLGLRRVILVGNSLGGPVSLAAAQRLGRDRVAGVVAVDTLHNVEARWPEEDWRRVLDSYRRDFRAGCDGLMLSLLHAEAPAGVRERIERDTCENEPRAAIALLETLRDYDQAAALRDAGVPVWAINSRAFPTAVEVNRKYAPAFDVMLIDGVGHYPQVERPEEFQRRLREAAAAATVAQATAVAPAGATKTVVIPKGRDAEYDHWGYAPAIRIGDTVIVSGIPAGGVGDYAAKVRRMFERARKTLEAAGASMDDVVELTSFHAEAKDTAAFQREFETLSRVHAEFFPRYKPAWTAVGTSALLADGAVLEMRFVAVVGSGKQILVERQGAAQP